jgi:NADPH2:quinone reductase
MPHVDRAYSLDEAGEATRHLIEDQPFGKVVLTM